MARDQQARDRDEEASLLDRRKYLKLTGAAAATVATSSISATAATSDVETITVGAGETFTKSLSDGETWENKLIDITADNAAYDIDAFADDWTIRNIGVKGTYPDRNDGSSEPIWVRVDSENATGTIENVYLGDGAVGTDYSENPGSKATGIYVDRNHAGHLDIRNVNVSGWPDNGIYASSPGNPDGSTYPGAGGTVAIESSYSERCGGGSGFRIGTTGSYCQNCVAVDGYDRGFWGYYQETEFINCDAYQNRVQWCANSDATITLTDCRSEGNFTGGACGGTINGDPASNPRTSPPQGVPTTPEEAASGQTDSDSSPSSKLVSPSDGDSVSATVTVQVDATDSEDDDTTLDVDVSVDGTWQTAVYNSTSGYYEYDWDTTTVSDGDHTVQARVTDSNGATTSSGQITVTVANISDSAPSIDGYVVTEAGSPNPHAEITADWTVADTGGNLDTVDVVVADSMGSQVDSATTNVDGTSASGTDQFKLKHAGGEIYDVTLTVTDANGNATSRTQRVSS